MRDIDERGLRSVMEEAIRIACDGTAGSTSRSIWIRSTRKKPRVWGRRSGRHDLSRSSPGDGDDLRLRIGMSLEVVEVNPVIDEANRTAVLAVELLMSAMGNEFMKTCECIDQMECNCRVAVIYGGRSGEHEISLRSAKSVMEAMDPEKYKILHYLISKDGKWHPQADLA